MATNHHEIDPVVLQRIVRVAESRRCSPDELLDRLLRPLEQPAPTADPLWGLWADEPELVDQVMETVYRSREHDPLRQPNHGTSAAGH